MCGYIISSWAKTSSYQLGLLRTSKFFIFKIVWTCLAAWLSWLAFHPGSKGCRFHPWWGHVCKAADQSFSQINAHILRWGFKRKMNFNSHSSAQSMFWMLSNKSTLKCVFELSEILTQVNYIIMKVNVNLHGVWHHVM